MTNRWIPVFTLLLLLLFGGCESNETIPPVLPEETTPPAHQTAGEPEPSGAGDNSAAAFYEPGDIILADGSRIGAADLKEIDGANPPVAVSAGVNDNGTAIGVGLHRSGTTLQWAPEGTSGNSLKFADTVCIQDESTAFHGNTVGGGNWDIICSVDKDGTMDAEENYPAFHFVNTYAEVHGLTGELATGWYMPTIAELCTVYENREAINTALKKISGLDSTAAMDGLGTIWYWASSQAESGDDYQWFVHFFNGYAGECPKSFDNLHVLAVHEF